MLVLSRKLGESVTLACADGTVIVVTLVDVDRGRVRLGFAAPRSVVIQRSELLGVPSGLHAPQPEPPREPAPPAGAS